MVVYENSFTNLGYFMSSLVYSLDHQDPKKIRFFLLEEMFEKHTPPPPWCKIQKVCIYTMNYPLSSDNHCPKFGNYQVNDSQNIERSVLI